MNCASCNAELKLVFERRLRRYTDYTEQYDNALPIHFKNGYGMFYDSLEFLNNRFVERDETLIICHDCAHKLVAENPWMRAVVDDTEGHSHEGKCHDAEHSHP